MAKKNILIISRSFFPHNSPRSFRTTELVKEFSKKGHNVTILTHKNDKKEVYVNFENEYKVSIKDLGKTFLPRIKLGKNRYSNLLKRAFSRGLNLLFEYPDIELIFLINKALKKEKGYDMLISVAVPHSTHWGVAWVLKKNNKLVKVWVADCGDPYMGDTTDSFKKLFYFKYVEKWWCKKATYISVPFKGALNAYYTEFQHKIKVIPQGFNFDENIVHTNNYIQHKIPTFAYSGLFIPNARDPRPFIEYLLSLEINFKFIIYNRQKEMISDLIDRANGKIEIRDYIDRKTLIKTLSKMDFVVNINNISTAQLPSKLIDYYFTTRPVLSIDSYDLDKKKIDQFLIGNFTNKYCYDNIDQYNIENVCNQFLFLCNH